jgi:hypothetical protein
VLHLEKGQLVRETTPYPVGDHPHDSATTNGEVGDPRPMERVTRPPQVGGGRP